MKLTHLSFATDQRWPLFETDAKLFQCLRVVARVAGRRLVLFIVVDDHLHVIVACEAGELGALRRALWQALQPIVDAELAPPRTRPVRDRRHLSNSLGYLLRQTDHHRLRGHPASWTGSCFFDLVGARCIAGMELAMFRLVPRLDVTDVYRAVRLRPVVLPTAAEVRAAGAKRLVSAAHAAVGVVPGATRPRGEVIRARRCAVSLGQRAGIAGAELRWALDAAPRTFRRLASQPAEIVVERATLLQIAIADAVVAANAKTA